MTIKFPATTSGRAFQFALASLALAILFTATSFLTFPLTAADSDKEVNIFSYREPGLIAPLLKAFTDETGIRTNVVYSKSGLIERLAEEGRNSEVDVLLTVDIGRLSDAVEKGLSQAVSSESVKANIPEAYRDPAGQWIGLSQRARLIYASKKRVQQNSITYAELADPKWRGRICARSGQHTYNIGLLASIVAHEGAEKAEAWARGVRDNLARKPAGGDRDQVKGIYAGECDIAIGNSYYMAAMQTNTKKPQQQEWAASVKLLFPNAEGRGTHVNVSGAVLAKHAPHAASGIRLIEFLASDKGQKIYADIVNEYPLKLGIEVSERVKSWGTLTPDKLPLSEIAKHRKTASEIMDRVNFDAGPGA